MAVCPEIELQRNALISSLLGETSWRRFLIVLRVVGRSDAAGERDEAEGGGSGGLDEPAAGGGEGNH